MKLTFSDLCLLLRTGQADLADLGDLTAFSEEERLYLRACPAARRENWEALADILPLPDASFRGRPMTLQRRRPLLCLKMGGLAESVDQHEDALGWYTRCVQFLDQRRMNDESQRIQALCGRGRCLLHSGEAPAALEEFRLAETLAQKTGERPWRLFAGLCAGYLATGQPDAALARGTEGLVVLGRLPDPSAASQNVKKSARRAEAGTIVSIMADWEETEQYLFRVLVGRCYAQKGLGDAAVGIWKQVAALAGSDEIYEPAAQALLLLAERERSQGRLKEARRLCNRGILCAAEGSAAVYGSFLMLGGSLAEAASDLAGAVRWYEDAVWRLPVPDARRTEAHRRLARLAENAGDMAQALLHWKAAVQKGQDE